MQMRKSSLGVSPIIATLLLIAITVAAGIIVYVFVSGTVGNLTQGGGQQTGQQVELTSYAFSLTASSNLCDGQAGATAPCLVISVKNTGGSAITIDQIFFDGQPLTPAGSPSLSLNTDQDATYLLASANASPGFNGVTTGLTGGSTHVVKIVTATGGLFSYTVIAGSSQ